MKAEIKSLAGELHCSMLFDWSVRVWQVKEMIEKEAGVPKKQQHLLHRYLELSDQKALAEQVVVSENACTLVLVQAEDSIAHDVDLAMLAVREDPRAIRLLPEPLRDNRELVLAALQEGGREMTYLQYASPELRADSEMVKMAIARNPRNYQFALGEPAEDREIAFSAVQADHAMYKRVPESLRSDRDLALLAVSGSCFPLWDYLDKSLKADREIIMAVLPHKGLYVKDIPQRVVDKEIALTAVRQDGLALQHLPTKWQKDNDVIMAGVQQNGLALQFCGSKKSGSKSKHSDPEVPPRCAQRDLVWAALQQNPRALQFASDELCEDEEIAHFVMAYHKPLVLQSGSALPGPSWPRELLRVPENIRLQYGWTRDPTPEEWQQFCEAMRHPCGRPI